MVTAATRLMEAGTRGSIILAPQLTRTQALTALAQNVGAGLLLSGVIVAISVPMAHGFAHGGDPLVLAVLGLSVVTFAPAIVRWRCSSAASSSSGAQRAGRRTITASTLAVASAVLGAGVWSLVIRSCSTTAAGIAGLDRGAPLLPPRDAAAPNAPRRLARAGALSFMLFSLTDFVVFNATT